MAAVKDWVAMLVTLALLAGCLDLVLPTGSMKKYVRLTMGLLVVLTVVRPVAAFIGHPVDLEAAVAAAAPTDARLPSLDQILAKAAQFRERNRSVALDQARQQMAQEAAAAARGVAGVSAATAAVDLGGEGSGVRIKQLTVTVRTGGGVARVDPVAPVGEGRSRPDQPAVAPVDPAVADSVRKAVAQRLGVFPDPEVIRVVAGSRP